MSQLLLSVYSIHNSQSDGFNTKDPDGCSSKPLEGSCPPHWGFSCSGLRACKALPDQAPPHPSPTASLASLQMSQMHQRQDLHLLALLPGKPSPPLNDSTLSQKEKNHSLPSRLHRPTPHSTYHHRTQCPLLLCSFVSSSLHQKTGSTQAKTCLFAPRLQPRCRNNASTE